MTSAPRTRFVLVGGFLGAGKTTLIGQLARHYTAAGKRVGIITNDQAADLVDTRHLRGQGFDVGEVAGACFCCSFDDLVETAESFTGDQAPDILLAEPVGSCTDLVATVILPLQQIFGDRFELAPFGVLLKPSHGRRILQPSGGASGFSPQAEYIFYKQLEEADFLMIGRRDQLSSGELDSLSDALADAAEGVPVIAVSPRDGDGIDQVVAMIDASQDRPRRLLEIDYDIYADGEAELGWVNLAAVVVFPEPVDLDVFARDVVERISAEIIDQDSGQIAHLKASVTGGDAQAVANVVSNASGVDVGLLANRQSGGRIQVVVNARVAMPPEELKQMCHAAVGQFADSHSGSVDSIKSHALRPGRPTPTHRYQSA